MGYSHLSSQKDHLNIELGSNFHFAELDDEQVVPKISRSRENENPHFSETIERCFEIQSEKLILHLFSREGLDPRELVCPSFLIVLVRTQFYCVIKSHLSFIIISVKELVSLR